MLSLTVNIYKYKYILNIRIQAYTQLNILVILLKISWIEYYKLSFKYFYCVLPILLSCK